MLNAEELLERLFKYYNVVNVAELSKIIGSSQATISNWKIRNSINAIKRKCRELGIYDDIFKQELQEFAEAYLSHVEDFEAELPNPAKSDNIDSVTYTLFKEEYQIALKKNDLKGFRIYLLNYSGDDV